MSYMIALTIFFLGLATAMGLYFGLTAITGRLLAWWVKGTADGGVSSIFMPYLSRKSGRE